MTVGLHDVAPGVIPGRPRAPLRVCDLTTLYIDGDTGGGVNTYLHEKARYLARAGVRHEIIVPGQVDGERALFGSRVHVLASPSLPSNPQHRVLWRLREVKRLLRKLRPTVVEVDASYLLGGVARSALPAEASIFGFYHVHLPTFIARTGAGRLGSLAGRVAETVAWQYVRYCSRSCDRLLVTSWDIHERLRAAGFQNLELLPLGVNLDVFRPGPPVPRPGRPLVLLYVGRLSREKELEVLVAAFKLIGQRGDYRLRIVGEGPVRARLERLVAGDPRVELAGSRPYGAALAEAYASADVFAIPSPNETFGLAVVEALAAGLPVVAMRQGGPMDLVHAGVGALAEPGNAADLASKIETVLGEPDRAHERRSYVAQHYSWDRTFERLLAVYDRTSRERVAP